MRQIVFGPPGTGKTTYLLGKVQEHLKRGVAPDRIAFVSFSRRAIAEAIARIRESYADIEAESFEQFRTIHSTAYHLLGLTRGDVLHDEHLKQFSEFIGLPMQGRLDEINPIWEGTPADQALTLYQLSRARETSVEHEWRQAMLKDVSWTLLTYVVSEYNRFKDANGLYDFSDMIAHADAPINADVLVVDEAQDTSVAQWSMLKRCGHHIPVCYFAGDDDQAVYEWSGADPRRLLRLAGDRHVLPTSYRLPECMRSLAEAVAENIAVRAAKAYHGRDGDGRVDIVDSYLHCNLREGTWLLLARSNFQLNALRGFARSQGVVYTLPNGAWSWSLPSVRAAVAYEQLRKGKTIDRAHAVAVRRYLPPVANELPSKQESYSWKDVVVDGHQDKTWMDALTQMAVEEREYIRELRKNNEPLDKPGRVTVSTVHNAKGSEADHVILLTDVTRRIEQARQINPDAELRVQYVGMTRARSTLTLVQPSTPWHWTLPKVAAA